MKNGFILAMLIMAIMFSLFAFEPQKIDTGQIIKNDVVVNQNFATFQTSEYALIEYQANFNLDVEKLQKLYSIKNLPLFTSITHKTFSPKQDYGVAFTN